MAGVFPHAVISCVRENLRFGVEATLIQVETLLEHFQKSSSVSGARDHFLSLKRLLGGHTGV